MKTPLPAARHFSEISHWTAPPSDISAPLREDMEAEFVIIGGGYTGLSAALKLRDFGREVLLLEQEFCGYGASGRNAGHLTPTIGKDVFSCIKYFGKARGLELIRFGERAVEHVERVIKELNIDCEYHAGGNVVAGLHESQRPALAKSAAIAAEHGVKAAFLDETEMRRRKLPSAFLFGVYESGGGHLHPGKLVQGLRGAAIDAGVQICEQTKVSSIEKGAPVIVTANNRKVKARRLFLATNAFSPTSLSLFRNKIAPLAVSQFATKPLSTAQLDRLGWSGREGIYTAHESLENYRLTEDGRIVGGSKYVRYGYGGKLPPAHHEKTFAQMESTFRARFAELPDLEIDTFWSGWIALVLDFLPICGALDGEDNIFYSLGYNGHGVAQASYMGTAMGARMAGEENDALDVLKRKPLTLPPEPLRWVAVESLLTILAAMDAKTDRRIMKANAASSSTQGKPS